MGYSLYSLDCFLAWTPQNIDSVELLHNFDAEAVLQNVQRYKMPIENEKEESNLSSFICWVFGRKEH